MAEATVMRARLLLADDHELARSGLRLMLEDFPDVVVVGEAHDGREAVDLCGVLAPDLVLMDVRMPDMDGLAATRAIKARWPRIAVVIVTMHENPDYFLDAIKAGAAGYVLKDAPQREILHTVRTVLRGDLMLNAALATQTLVRLAKAPTTSRSMLAEQLTPREHEVLRLVSQGLTNKEIGRALVVSAGTIKAHVEHIIAKLDVSDRTQAAVRAAELGLLAASPRSG